MHVVVPKPLRTFGRHALARPEDRRADAHAGRAEGDRQLVVAGHAHRQLCRRRPRRASFASSAKCGPGFSSAGGMHISPSIASPCTSRQRCTKATASRGLDAGLLRLRAGVDLHVEPRRLALPARFPWRARRRSSRGRPSRSRRTAPPPPWPCWIAAGRSGAARCPGIRPSAPAICLAPPARGFRRRRAGRPR